MQLDESTEGQVVRRCAVMLENGAKDMPPATPNQVNEASTSTTLSTSRASILRSSTEQAGS
jgi:hypothetical protein